MDIHIHRRANEEHRIQKSSLSPRLWVVTGWLPAVDVPCLEKVVTSLSLV